MIYTCTVACKIFNINMVEFVLPDVKYIFPLDDLDITLLSNFVQKPVKESGLIWSKNHLDGEVNQCQVDILTKDEDCFGKELPETYQCYICNIKIYKKHRKLHEQSEKHKIYEKLTNIILNNYTKQRRLPIFYIDDDNCSNVFYCDACSTVVPIKREQEHNSTEEHLKATQDLELAADFLDFIDTGQENIENYFDENIEEGQSDFDEVQSKLDKSQSKFNGTDADSEDSSDDASTIFHSDNEEYMDIINQINSYNHDPINQINNYNHDPINQINNYNHDPIDSVITEKPDSKIEIDNTSEDIKEFKLYLQEILVKYYVKNELNFNLMVFDDSIDIITSMGQRHKVSVDVFHSYKTVDDKVFCQICQMWLDGNSKEHIVTELHLRLVTQAIDANFARQINEKWNHCLVCNERIYPNTDHATLNSYHTSQLNKSFYNSGSNANDDVTGLSFCYICCLNIPKETVLYHLNSSLHKDRWKSHNEGNTKSPSKQTTQFNKTYTDDTEILLKLKNEVDHEQNTDCRIDSSKFEFLDDGSDKNFIARQFRYIDTKFIMCRVCNKILDIDKNCVTNHVSQSIHLDTVSNVLKNNKIVLASASDLLYYCKYCDIVTTNYLDHIEQAEHYNLVKLNNLVDITRLWRILYRDNGVRSREICYKDLYRYILNHNNIEPKKKRYQCKLCLTELTIVSLTPHILNKDHITRVKMLKT